MVESTTNECESPGQLRNEFDVTRERKERRTGAQERRDGEGWAMYLIPSPRTLSPFNVGLDQPWRVTATGHSKDS